MKTTKNFKTEMEWDNTEQNYLVHLVAIIIIIIMLRKEALAFFLLLLLQIVIHLWLEKVFFRTKICACGG